MSWISRGSNGLKLTVTDAAGQYILGVLQRHNVPDDVGARLYELAGGLEIKLDQAKPGDVTVSHQGRMIILLDAPTTQSFAYHTVDFEQTSDGPQLMLRLPDNPRSR